MKTKLLIYAIQKFKNDIKLNGIFTFLIIFFMTFSSFGQVAEITFNCDENIIKFSGPPDGVVTYNGINFPSWSNGSFNSTLSVEELTLGTLEWGVRSADFGGIRLFKLPLIGNAEEGYAPTLCSEDWESSWVSDTFVCVSLVVSCTGGPAEPPEEICDGIDNDGDDEIDEGLSFTTYYRDFDDDGFGDRYNSVSTCDGAPTGFVANSMDCYDEVEEINYDGNDTVYPDASEICDGLDNNCDGQIDEGIAGCIEGVIVDYCDDQNKKILICHNGKTKCVSINAMDAHLAHGDYLGPCGGNSREGDIDISEEDPTSYDVVSWPNPSNNLFNIKMVTPNSIDKVDLKAFDINGRLIHSKIINGNEDYQFGDQLSSGVYFVRLSQAYITKVIKVIKQ